MIEPMWAWGILGLILIAIEMASGTFYILWFGISALCMSITLALFPAMPPVMQLFLFAALSLGSLAIWKATYRKAGPDLRVGQSQGDEIGRIGTIIEPVSPRQNGSIRFAQGVMGSREWTAISDETIEAGADAVITSIEGNALRVSKSTIN
ncbi:MAG TPA: NfeD family protein [Methylophilaceae bacterium]|nr:NfeD family protein [Methylophilaceae bacterium]